MLNPNRFQLPFLSSWITGVYYYTRTKIIMPFHHSASNSHAWYSLSTTSLTTKYTCICKNLTAAAYLLLSNTCYGYWYKLNQDMCSKCNVEEQCYWKIYWKLCSVWLELKIEVLKKWWFCVKRWWFSQDQFLMYDLKYSQYYMWKIIIRIKITDI